MTRQEVIDYAKAEFAKVGGTYLSVSGSEHDALVIVFGPPSQEWAVAVSISGLEFMQNNEPERCKELVESRVDNAIRTYKIAEAESVPA